MSTGRRGKIGGNRYSVSAA
ncbi:hypothetical protein VTO58DRAFT_107496 [Aureobasidium pullulans]